MVFCFFHCKLVFILRNVILRPSLLLVIQKRYLNIQLSDTHNSIIFTFHYLHLLSKSFCIVTYIEFGCLSSLFGRALGFDSCLLGLIPVWCMWDGKGCLIRQSGFLVSHNTGFFQPYRHTSRASV